LRKSNRFQQRQRGLVDALLDQRHVLGVELDADGLAPES
jgi:hypothetical protein